MLNSGTGSNTEPCDTEDESVLLPLSGSRPNLGWDGGSGADEVGVADPVSRSRLNESTSIDAFAGRCPGLSTALSLSDTTGLLEGSMVANVLSKGFGGTLVGMSLSCSWPELRLVFSMTTTSSPNSSFSAPERACSTLNSTSSGLIDGGGDLEPLRPRGKSR